VRVGVVAAYLVAVALSFQPLGEQTYRNGVFHRPFVIALAVAAALAAWAAWLRHRADGRGGSLWLAIAFATLALLYAPHGLLDASRLDITHLLFGPVSRLGFSLLLLPVVLDLPVPGVRRLPRWGAAAALVVPAVAIDAGLHLALGSHFVHGHAGLVRLAMESVALGAQLLCAGVLVVLYARRRRPFLLHLAFTLTALASGSALFLVATPWQGRWWVAHLGLFVGAVVLVSGIVDEAARRGGIGGAVDLDPLSEFAEHIVNAMRDGIALHDEPGRLIAWNPAAAELTGWSASEAARRDVTGFRQGLVGLDDERWVDVVRLELTRYGRPYTATILSDARDRVRVSTMALELELRAHELEQSNEAAQRARAEAELANRAKSEFLSRMSHELRTPLNAILGFSQLLELDNPSPEHRESVEHILAAGRHLLQLIDETLDIARIEQGRLALSIEPVHLGEVMRESLDLVRPLAGPANIRIRVDAAQFDRRVLVDRQRLRQVLMNLLSNAVKYNRDGGDVTITCAPTPGGRLRVAVADTGPGIPAEMMGRLFLPFERLGAERTPVEGTGIGLSICKRLVELMGGHIGADSEMGRGSTFWVELEPAEAPQERPGPAAQGIPAAPAGTGGDATVLYVEDNLSNLRLVERILARRPATRLVAATQGSLALELAREHRPELILLDVHLPDMEGDEVLQRLREDPETRDIPVVAVSAEATPRKIERFHAAGARAYLTKPLDLRQFLQVVDEILTETIERPGNGPRPTADPAPQP